MQVRWVQSEVLGRAQLAAVLRQKKKKRARTSSIVGRARLLDARRDCGGDLILTRRALADGIASGAARGLDGGRETSNLQCSQHSQLLSHCSDASSARWICLWHWRRAELTAPWRMISFKTSD